MSDVYERVKALRDYCRKASKDEKLSDVARSWEHQFFVRLDSILSPVAASRPEPTKIDLDAGIADGSIKVGDYWLEHGKKPAPAADVERVARELRLGYAWATGESEGALLSHKRIAEKVTRLLDAGPLRKASKRLRDAAYWLLHLAHGISKSGEDHVLDDEWVAAWKEADEARLQVEAALRYPAPPSGEQPTRCACCDAFARPGRQTCEEHRDREQDALDSMARAKSAKSGEQPKETRFRCRDCGKKRMAERAIWCLECGGPLEPDGEAKT